MIKRWIKYLCDPVDKSSLEIDKITKRNGNDVIFGTLRSKSGRTYKIKNGVPVLLNRYTQPTKSVDSFAYEWESFDYDYGKKSWIRDIVKPVLGSVEYFRNKIVIDCGAGSGRQSLWIAEAGAKFVFSIELSNSSMTMVREVTKKYKDRVFVIQADIAHLPIKKKTADVDVAYCVNVIQHTKSPLKTISEISKLLNKKSEIVFNIYLERQNSYLIGLVQFFKRLVSKLPKPLINLISMILAVGLYPIKSKNHDFKGLWLEIYDLLGTHWYQKFYTEEYLAGILKKLKLKISKESYYAMILSKI